MCAINFFFFLLSKVLLMKKPRNLLHILANTGIFNPSVNLRSLWLSPVNYNLIKTQSLVSSQLISIKSLFSLFHYNFVQCCEKLWGKRGIHWIWFFKIENELKEETAWNWWTMSDKKIFKSKHTTKTSFWGGALSICGRSVRLFYLRFHRKLARFLPSIESKFYTFLTIYKTESCYSFCLLTLLQ